MNRAARAAAAAAIGSAVLSGSAWAQPSQGGISLQPAKSPIAHEVHAFHNWVLMPVMVGISLLVLALLVWVVLKYNAKANPEPRKFSHNTLVEILWTGIPIIILLFIALFSFDLLYKEDMMPDGKQVVFEADGSQSDFVFVNDFSERRMLKRPEHIEVSLAGADGEQPLRNRRDYRLEGLGEDVITVAFKEPPAAGESVIIRGGRTVVGPGKVLGVFGKSREEIALAPTVTLKVNGYQWGWNYAYPDFGDFEIDSLMLSEDQTTPELYRLAVDNPIVLPVGETIRVVTTARDVIHSWAMPNFAVKIDAVPGRINETWIKADEPGTYYGQCSEICGIKHSFMPIEVRMAPREEFLAWVDEQRALNGMAPMAATDEDRDGERLAAAE